MSNQPHKVGKELLQSEMGVADQAAFLNSILDSSTEYSIYSIVAKDLSGTILAWNHSAYDLLTFFIRSST